jgi:hypothetical protein
VIMKLMFFSYLAITVAGLVIYIAVGLTHS